MSEEHTLKTLLEIRENAKRKVCLFEFTDSEGRRLQLNLVAMESLEVVNPRHCILRFTSGAKYDVRGDEDLKRLLEILYSMDLMTGRK